VSGASKITVNISKAQLDYFRKRARQCKKEIFAILFGRVLSDTEVDVVYFDYPRLEISTPAEVLAEADDAEVAVQSAEKVGLEMVGTIHSHIGVPCYMSTQDREGHIEEGSIISGIVEVIGGRTRVAFWQARSPVPCNIEYFPPCPT